MGPLCLCAQTPRVSCLLQSVGTWDSLSYLLAVQKESGIGELHGMVGSSKRKGSTSYFHVTWLWCKMAEETRAVKCLLWYHQIYLAGKRGIFALAVCFPSTNFPTPKVSHYIVMLIDELNHLLFFPYTSLFIFQSFLENTAFQIFHIMGAHSLS